MEFRGLKSMSTDELWTCHTELVSVLARKISAKKQQLDHRLRQLHLEALEGTARRERRPYPRVLPKYRNPDDPSETWAGRGKQPRWLAAQLRIGRTLEDLRIQQSSDRKRRSPCGDSSTDRAVFAGSPAPQRSQRKTAPASVAEAVVLGIASAGRACEGLRPQNERPISP